MRKTVLILAVIAGFFAGAITAKAGDITETRDLSSFEKIVIEDAGVGIDVKVGKDFSVSLKGTEKWIARTTTDVESGALVISQKKKKKPFASMDSDNRIIITMPKFVALTVNGAVDANISGVDSEIVKFEIDGAGNIEVTGKCGTLRVELNGAGNFEGENMECKNVKIQINGAGNVEAYGSQSANLEINGIGNIDLYGNPDDIKKDSSWFSNISIHE